MSAVCKKPSQGVFMFNMITKSNYATAAQESKSYKPVDTTVPIFQTCGSIDR